MATKAVQKNKTHFICLHLAFGLERYEYVWTNAPHCPRMRTSTCSAYSEQAFSVRCDPRGSRQGMYVYAANSVCLLTAVRVGRAVCLDRAQYRSDSPAGSNGLDCPWRFQHVGGSRLRGNRHTKVVKLSAPRTGRPYPSPQEIFMVLISVRRSVDPHGRKEYIGNRT